MTGLDCTYLSVKTDIPFQIWEAITTDPSGGTPLLMTRALHNKPLYYFTNLSRSRINLSLLSNSSKSQS